ncbi:hypothetical protein TWF281_010851 [Arthrobotrys megalospora]
MAFQALDLCFSFSEKTLTVTPGGKHLHSCGAAIWSASATCKNPHGLRKATLFVGRGSAVATMVPPVSSQLKVARNALRSDPLPA